MNVVFRKSSGRIYTKMDDLNEIKQFLEPQSRFDLKQIAIAHILSK